MRVSSFLRTGCMAVACLASSMVAFTASADDRRPDDVERTLVFSPGDYDSKFYRIPALAVMSDGNLLAVADKRIDKLSDLPGRIDVVGRISTDNGRTWGDFFTILENDSIGGYGDPAVVVDRNTGDVIVICSHGNGLWQDAPANITVVRSTDNGRTWGEPLNINPMILTAEKDGPQPIKNVAGAFASSGAALQLDNGRLMFSLVVRERGRGGFYNYAIYSDDGGHTWQVAENPATGDGDEAKVAQLEDGTVIMSIRSRQKFGHRSFSYSHDRGKTWSEPVLIDDLPDPACNGDFIVCDYNGRQLLLQSMPAVIKIDPDFKPVQGTSLERADIGVYGSFDGGKTFPVFRQITWGPAAYSSMAILPDGSLGVLTEEAVENAGPTHQGGYRLWFLKMPLTEITGESAGK